MNILGCWKYKYICTCLLTIYQLVSPDFIHQQYQPLLSCSGFVRWWLTHPPLIDWAEPPTGKPPSNQPHPTGLIFPYLFQRLHEKKGWVTFLHICQFKNETIHIVKHTMMIIYMYIFFIYVYVYCNTVKYVYIYIYLSIYLRYIYIICNIYIHGRFGLHCKTPASSQRWAGHLRFSWEGRAAAIDVWVQTPAIKWHLFEIVYLKQD